ncbi:hypothetical protein Bca4012_052872 [Brassica carinata]
MIRIRLDLGILTPVALTYQLPEWMLHPEGATTPPITLSSDRDVETMMAVAGYMAEPVMYVTTGPELVAKYEFLRRSPFKIGDWSFLGEGITEEQHKQAIKDLVGGHPIVCSKNMLEMLFNEPQLLIVYRVALEIEMVYAPSAEERNEYPCLTVDDMIIIVGGEPIETNGGMNVEPNQEVLHGEPMDVDHLQLLNPNFGPPNTQPLGMPLEVEPLTQIPIIEPDVNEVQVNWNALPEDENGVEDNDTGSPRPTNGALGLQNGQTRRVTAPTSPTTVLLGHDDEGSYTGSSDGQNDGANNHDSIPALPNSENVINITEGLEQGDEAAAIQNASDAIIQIEDSDSDADGDGGGTLETPLGTLRFAQEIHVQKYTFITTTNGDAVRKRNMPLACVCNEDEKC